MEWQVVPSKGSEFFKVYRSKVPGGWLVFMSSAGDNVALTFYPDPTHKWDGSSN